jgi:hypothetical protein
VEVEAGQVPAVRGQALAVQEQVLAAQTLLPAHILIRSHFTPTAWGRRKRSTRARRLTSNDRFEFKVALPIQLGAGATAATGGNRLAPHKIKVTA